MTRHRALAGLAVLFGATLALAACGGGGSSKATSAKTSPTKTTSSTVRAGETESTPSTSVPCPPSGAAATGTRALGSGGTEANYTISTGYQAVLAACTTALQADGWAVRGGGGGGWGADGGGGLGATKGAATVRVEAGGNGGPTYVNVCSWPGAASNDNCGDQDDDGNNDQNQNQGNQNQNGQNQNGQDQNQDQNNQNQNG